MKKIIELAEKYISDSDRLNGSSSLADVAEVSMDYDRLKEAITLRKTLEQTPITEDWMKEHGFILEADGYVFYDESKGTHDQYYVLVQLRHNKKETRRIEIRTMWRSFYAEQGIFNASFLLDACELCGITMD